MTFRVAAAQCKTIYPERLNWPGKLEVWFYMNGPSELAALLSSKQFFGLKFNFE